MPDLIAQGQSSEQRWRRKLPDDQVCLLGRDSGFWSVPWDRQISRQHAQLCYRDGSLSVSRVPEARNAIFVRGRAADRFDIQPGEHFVIGDTAFTLADEQVKVSFQVRSPVTEQTFSAEFLKRLRFHDVDRRIDILSRVPEIITGAVSDQEMLVRLTSLILSGIPDATAAALVKVAGDDTDGGVQVLHWDRRELSDLEFRPSAALIRQATELQQSVVHVWTGPLADHREDSMGLDWAFCTPVSGTACRGWAIYVTGRFAESISSSETVQADSLQDDLKFAELVAGTLANLREARRLERNQASLRQFLSPVVLDALAGQDADLVLAPRETDVSVLFCDLRGFSRESERSSEDLRGLLQRVSDALGVTTKHIMSEGGVVGDFHGDAAMGFWGWPFAQQDSVVRACRAALAIRAEFVSAACRPEHPLSDFRIGIGIASGRAVAGKIGTVDQVKVTVFGPVVNLAARLESMTKQLRAPILLDETTALHAREQLPAETGRLRRVAVVQPYGIDRSLEVSELLPPARDFSQLSDEDIRRYESALDALQAGQWQTAFQRLHDVPADDLVKDFLTVYIAQHNRMPPADWNGVIVLDSK